MTGQLTCSKVTEDAAACVLYHDAIFTRWFFLGMLTIVIGMPCIIVTVMVTP